MEKAKFGLHSLNAERKKLSYSSTAWFCVLPPQEDSSVINRHPGRRMHWRITNDWLAWLVNWICFLDKGQPCSLKSRAESFSKIVNGLCKHMALVGPDLFWDALFDTNLHR